MPLSQNISILYELGTGTVYNSVDKESWDSMFVLDDGIFWGMSMEEVKSLVPEELDEQSGPDYEVLLSTIYPEDGTFNMTGKAYYFEDDQLAMYFDMKQTYTEPDQETFDQLANSMILKYGQPYEIKDDSIRNIIHVINGDYEPNIVLTSYCWEDSEGTRALLFTEEDYGNSQYFLIYISPAFWEKAAG